MNGVDQVYSYYNGTPRQTARMYPMLLVTPILARTVGTEAAVILVSPPLPIFAFITHLQTARAKAQPPPACPPASGDHGYALEVSDDNVNSYGEWFSDWNPLGAVATAGGGVLQFWYEDTAPQPRDGQLRVTINFGDAVNIGDITAGDPNNLGHIDTTFNNPSAGVGTWTEVDVPLGPLPAGTESARITVDSGGGSDTTGDIWVSDISVAVPEPASIGVITAGSMLLLAKRRRAKAAV